MPTDIRFPGHRLDATGLYYYNARYYDATIGRFLSPDSVMPDITNPQSLNRYSYVFNNPLKYNDPTGNWPDWSKIGKAISNSVQAAVNVVKQNIDTVQTVLDVAGMVPVVGEAFDAVNGAIYTARGDYANAALSFAACVPVVGSAATGVKLVGKAVNKVTDVVKAIDKAGDASSTFRNTQIVQRAMSADELQATRATGLLRGGREGTHYVSPAINSNPLRARQRLALDQTPEVRVTMEVPSEAFSKPAKIAPKYNMPGGGMQQTATGSIPVNILSIYWYYFR